MTVLTYIGGIGPVLMKNDKKSFWAKQQSCTSISQNRGTHANAHLVKSILNLKTKNKFPIFGCFEHWYLAKV